MSDLKSIGERIAGAAPILAAALGGPAAGAAASLAVKALGLNSPEELESVSPEQLAEAERTIAPDLRKAELDAATQITLAQIGVNKRAAKSASLFVSGARPAVIWIGAIALGYHFIFRPFGNAAAVIWMGGPLIIDGAPFDIFPPIDIAGIITITGGLLGFGGKRTIEKIKGVARNSLRDPV